MAAMRSRGVLLSQNARSSLMDESFFKSSLLTVFSIISIPRASYGRCRFEPCRTWLIRFPNWLLKNLSLPRLLKRVQMQGAVTHPDGWVPAAGYPLQVGRRRT